MKNEEKFLHEYTFATKKSIAIVCFLMFFGAGAFFVIMSWKEQSWFLAIMGSLSIGLSLMGVVGARSKKKIRVFEDHLETPQSLWSKKVKTIPFSEITGVFEVGGGGIPTIRIESSTQKPAQIASAQMEDKDFYDLLDFLEKKVNERPIQSSPIISSDNQKLINKIFLWAGALFTPAVIIFIRHQNKQLKTMSDWLVTLGLIALIFGAGILQSKLTKSASDHARKNKEHLSRPEIKKIKWKWYGIVLGATVIFMGLSIWAMKLPHEGNLSMWPFFNYALVMIILTIMILHRFMPKVEGVVAPTEYYSAYFLVGMFGLFFFLFMGAHLNIAKDESMGERKESPLVGRFLVTQGYKRYCYKLSHWENGGEIGEESFCNDKFPRLKEGDIARYQVFKGYFDLPYVKDVHFPRYDSAESYISSIEGEDNLRFFDIQALAKLRGEGIWNSKSGEWSSDCNNGSPSKCRLASYVSHLNKNMNEVKNFLITGCNQKDFLSCYNYLFHEEFSKSEKIQAKSYLLRECEKDKNPNKERKAICDYIPKIHLEG